MTSLVKTIGVLCACMLLFLLVRHGQTALQPTRPRDMPAQASFAQSGYDVQHLEAKGDWIACGTDIEQQTNWCRVTDNHGQVVYQGDFLPSSADVPVPSSQLALGNIDPDSMWVQGPTEGGMVPVIPLADGRILVPADDREALVDRWASHPEELASVRTANGQR